MKRARRFNNANRRQFEALHKYKDSKADGRFQQNSKTKVITSLIDDMDKLNFYSCKSSVF